MRISLLRGVQSSALSGAAARGRRTLPPSCLAALRSRSLSLFLSLFLLFLLGGALRSRFSSSAYATAAGTTTGQTPPDPRAETRPAASVRERDAHDLASSRLRRPSRPICGGVNDAPGREKSHDAIDLARFAVAEHNSKTNAALEFVRLVKVRTQLVAGTMYYFTVEVREVDGGAGANYKLYEAKVWLRPWEKFKGLDTFEPVANADEGKMKI